MIIGLMPATVLAYSCSSQQCQNEDGESTEKSYVTYASADDGQHHYVYCPDCFALLATEDHVLGDYTYNNDATCVKDGTKSAHCQYCSYVTVPIADTDHPKNPDAHNWDTGNAQKTAATCEKAGTITVGCKNEGCSATNTYDDKDAPALGHEFKTYTYNNDATYTSDGTETAKCVRFDKCGKTDTRTAVGTKLVAASAAKSTDDTNAPQTGDNSNIALWLALLLAGGAVTVTSLVSKKRQYNR